MGPANYIVQTKPAPIGGLNARDSLANMPETDAVELINWIPDAGGVRARKGFREWAKNMPAEVKSLMAYFAPTTTFPAADFLTSPTVMPGTFFCATDSNIYNITTSTDAPASSKALSGTSQAGWISSTMMSNAAGTYLICASEADGYFHYNGTVWTPVVMGGGAGQVSGVNPNTFVHINMWKRRLWFVQKDTTKVWYLPTDSIAGAANAIDFGPLFKLGGHLAFTCNWTIDAGEGIDDFLVGVSSNGEVAVYKGTDPASSSTFGLVGVWKIGQVPVGRRGYTQYGGDLVLLGADGIYPISYVTRGGAGLLQATGQEYSSKIRARLGPALRASFTTRGWDMLMHPTERMMLVNVPNSRGYRDAQFAMNTTLNQWCVFQNIPINCLGGTGGYAFAGTIDGRVLILFADLLDEVEYDDDESGAPIYGVVQPAFTSFGTPAQQKIFTMLRPYFISLERPGLGVSVAVDYQISNSREYPATPALSASRFDSALWGSARWSAYSGVPFSDWVGIGGIGSAACALLQTATYGDTVLSAIDYMFTPGGPL